MDLTTNEILACIAPGLATGLGGLALLAIRRPTDRTLDALTGLTAGIMLAAAIFSLLVPALDRGRLGGVVAGFALGVAFLALLDYAVPHLHARFAERGHALSEEQAGAEQRAVLLLSALTIHNLPEGMAVGLAFAAGGPELGVPTAVAIGVQNVPEGFAAAAPLLKAGASRKRAIGFAAATGAVEPPAALLAAAAAGIAGGLLVGGLAFAAGAMIYVVVDELIPESHGRGNERLATLCFTVGFVVMLTLDNALG
jgi:ZIP family zinc transporter